MEPSSVVEEREEHALVDAMLERCGPHGTADLVERASASCVLHR